MCLYLLIRNVNVCRITGLDIILCDVYDLEECVCAHVCVCVKKVERERIAVYTFTRIIAQEAGQLSHDLKSNLNGRSTKPTSAELS